MSTVICLSNHKPIQFAKEELLKYSSCQNVLLSNKIFLGLEADFIKKGLIDWPKFSNGKTYDAFRFERKGNEVYIIGNNPRSVLFGAYELLKEGIGYRWVSFHDQETLLHSLKPITAPAIHKGKMKRRGLVIENYDNLDFLFKIIDWAGKHYINELFFTFMLWDKVKSKLAPEIEKRGISITLGGHSMHYLLGEETSAMDYQIDFNDKKLKRKLITKIQTYFEQSTAINRLSLWPADVGTNDDPRFLKKYIEFTEEVQSQLPTKVEVEHIAYNAGLSWNMLELPVNMKASKTINTLFAYWGRNYSQDFSKEKRAYQALVKWQEETSIHSRKLTMFEYYSDHFMLGGLFPPLFQRIEQDISLYRDLGVEGIVNLIVPYIPKYDESDMEFTYPWQLIQLMNAYYFARLSWGTVFQKIEEDFYSIFKGDQQKIKYSLQTLESSLSEVSEWNVPLFPARLIDPEKVTSYEKLHEIIDTIKKWKERVETLQFEETKEVDTPNKLIAFYVNYMNYKLENVLEEWLLKK